MLERTNFCTSAQGGHGWPDRCAAYRIRILMYHDVSCMYPEGYTYLECISNVSQMYLTCSVTFQEKTCILTFCMYFTRIPNESKIHFGIHIRYITIHVSCSLPWCHAGYISRYIKIRVSWTLHHDTSGYIEIQNHDTCILDAS